MLPFRMGPFCKLHQCCPLDGNKTCRSHALHVSGGSWLCLGQLQTLTRERVFQGRSRWVWWEDVIWFVWSQLQGMVPNSLLLHPSMVKRDGGWSWAEYLQVFVSYPWWYSASFLVSCCVFMGNFIAVCVAPHYRWLMIILAYTPAFYWIESSW